jgi:hypothetical protein
LHPAHTAYVRRGGRPALIYEDIVEIPDTEDEHDAELGGPVSFLLEERCRRSNSHGSSTRG